MGIGPRASGHRSGDGDEAVYVVFGGEGMMRRDARRQYESAAAAKRVFLTMDTSVTIARVARPGRLLLFRSKRDHRLHPCGAPRGNQRSQQRREAKENHGHQQHRWIPWSDAE
jgi:hypothetical protein